MKAKKNKNSDEVKFYVTHLCGAIEVSGINWDCIKKDNPNFDMRNYPLGMDMRLQECFISSLFPTSSAINTKDFGKIYYEVYGGKGLDGKNRKVSVKSKWLSMDAPYPFVFNEDQYLPLFIQSSPLEHKFITFSGSTTASPSIEEVTRWLKDIRKYLIIEMGSIQVKYSTGDFYTYDMTDEDSWNDYLSIEASNQIMNMIANPSPPNDKLKKAWKEYEKFYSEIKENSPDWP